MSASCPRCDAAEAAQLHAGVEGAATLWRVFHCSRCAFTWRDSEAATTIDPRRRPSWARLREADFGKLQQIIPIETTGSGEG